MNRSEELRVECERLGVAVEPPAQEFVARVDDFAKFFRYPLPEDFLWFMRNCSPDHYYGGFYYPLPPLKPESLNRPTKFWYDGRVFFNDDIALNNCPSDEWLEEVDPDVDQPWHTFLVSVMRAEHGRRYMLDYRYDAVNPPVILLDYPGAIRRSGTTGAYNQSRWVRFLAPSFTDFVKELRDFADDGSDEVEARLYPFGEELRAWNRSTFEYLEAHYGPIDPSYFPF